MPNRDYLSAYRIAIVLLALAILCSACNSASPTPASIDTNRPNVVLVMADDMGWGDVIFPVRIGLDKNNQPVTYPGTALWQMPNLQAMADNGLLFSRMYSQSPVCSPTRASVLTGRTPQRMNIPFANTGSLPNGEHTLPEYAKAIGYNTGFFGKWHLGVFTRDLKDANRGGTKNSHNIYSTPLMHSFDTQYATESKTSTYDPGTSGLTKPTRYWTGPNRFVPLDAPELKGDDSAIVVREANRFITQSVNNNKPFFAVVWFHTPHLPLNTPNNQDVDNLAAYRFAMEDMDTAIGNLREHLRELGVADSTLIAFTSDNGPERGHDHNATDTLRERKRALYEGGVRVPGIIEWPDAIRTGVTHTPMVTTDYLPTLLDLWNIKPIDDRPLDGQSMAEVLLRHREHQRETPIFFQSIRGLNAVIDEAGRYKAISTNNGNTWSLYDLVNDPSEQQPLLTGDPQKVIDTTLGRVLLQLVSAHRNWQDSAKNSNKGWSGGDYQTGVRSVDGAQLIHRAPRSLALGQQQSDQPQLIIERQNASLRESIEQADNANSPQADTMIDSFLIHLDPESPAAESKTTIEFQQPIVAVIADANALRATDELAFADPAFEPGSKRGLEANDAWSISENRKTITLHLRATSDNLDQVRILTRSLMQELTEKP